MNIAISLNTMLVSSVSISRLFSLTIHLLLISISDYIIHIYFLTQTHQIHEHCCVSSRKIQFQNSSLFCTYNILSDKLCFFNNLYFINDEQSGGSFIFMVNQNSTILGLENRRDLRMINLSSVKNHPKMFMNVLMVDSSQSLNSIFMQFLTQQDKQKIERFNAPLGMNENNPNFLESHAIIFNEPVFVIRRFKCDNIMHVIHDDLLPLFVTYYHLCDGDIDYCIAHYQLFFNDDCNSSEFLELYQIFSAKSLSLMQGAQTNSNIFLQTDRIYMFKSLREGLDTSMIWYSYGFTHQQGRAKDSKIDLKMLEIFCNFLIEKLRIDNESSRNDGINVLILNRKINRKIINSLELKKEIKSVSAEIFERDIIVSEADLYNNTVSNLMKQILQADVIVGMHSSTMILTIFHVLKKNTFVFELFPFGIQPEYVSFLHPLKEIVSQRIVYKFWANQEESNSVTYPQNSELFGGLQHLSLSEQEKIVRTKIVPPVKCCHDPAYLFRMYQDTLVSEDFLQHYRSGIKDFVLHNEIKSERSYWFFPASVTHVTCFFKSLEVLILWRAPKNTFYQDVKYKVAVSVNESKQLGLIVDENRFVLNLKDNNISQRPLRLSIWIKSLVLDHGEAESSDVYTFCAEDE